MFKIGFEKIATEDKNQASKGAAIAAGSAAVGAGGYAAKQHVVAKKKKLQAFKKNLTNKFDILNKSKFTGINDHRKTVGNGVRMIDRASKYGLKLKWGK